MQTVTIEQVAEAALGGNALLARHLALTFLRETSCLADVAPPKTDDPDVRAAAAALLELFAARRGEKAAPWTQSVHRTGHPIFLFRCAPHSFTYQLCLETTPEPLRKRGFYAPDNYLTFV